MSNVFHALVIIPFILCSLTTIRVAIFGMKAFKGEMKHYVIFHPAWLLVLCVILPMEFGAISRGEVNPLPWTEAMNRYESHSLIDAILSGSQVLAVDLWLFWIPSYLLLCKVKPDNSNNRWTFRSIVVGLNIFLGWAMTQEYNFIYTAIHHR